MSDLTSAVMAWCPLCGAYYGLYEGPGRECLGECMVEGHQRWPRYRKLIRRRFYFCPEGPRDHRGIPSVGFFDKTSALDHKNHNCVEFVGP